MRTSSLLLRGAALVIAIAGVVDPAITLSGASRPRLAIFVSGSSEDAAQVRARLVHDLRPAFDVVPAITSDSAAAVVIGDRYPGEPVRVNLPISTVTVPDAASRVRIVRADVPRQASAATTIHLDVTIEGRGVAGETTDVVARIAGVEVGRATRRWAASPERWRAGIDAVPVGDPPFAVRIEATTGGRLVVADSLVVPRREPFRVRMYEPRPSWAATFVRRALESDVRFDVAATSISSRGVAVRTVGDVSLEDPTLDGFDVVIAGGLDKLGVADVRALDRFARNRGGSVVLLPDARVVNGPAKAMLPDISERLVEQPAKLIVTPPAPAIAASELLILDPATPGLVASARLPGSELLPVIASTPLGLGRLMVSGAMDAWRFRASDADAFDRFWQSTIAGLALEAPPQVGISLDPPVVAPGGRVQVTVRLHSNRAGPISATLNGDQPIRLMPMAEAGMFHAEIVASQTAGLARVSVEAGAANPLHASAVFVVRLGSSSPDSGPSAPLSLLSSSHQGIDVGPERVAEIERFVRRSVLAEVKPLTRRPMRSAWWILPFAACLSADWWLRRRRGLR